MSNIFQQLLQAFSKQVLMNADAKQIAKHLAQVKLYELKGVDALLPDLKEKAIELAKRMEKLEMPIVIVETLRSVPRQERLFKKGTTWVHGLSSWHQYGLAFDVMFREYRWKPPSPTWWETLGFEGKRLGLIWGGDWMVRDMGHFQDPYTSKLLKGRDKLIQYFSYGNIEKR